MDENMNLNENSSENTAEQQKIQPAQYSWNNAAAAVEEQSPVMLRRKIKKGYNWSGAIILFEVLFIVVAMSVCSTIFSIVNTPKIMAENPDMSFEEITAKIVEMQSGGDYAVISNAVISLFGGVMAFIVVFFALKSFKLKSLFGKSEVPVSGIILAMLSIIGVQGFSIHVQNLVTMITGYTGINEQLTQSLGFTDNPVTNAVLILYSVLLGPVIEELLFRGIALNNLGAVNRTFALFASSLLFGLMHANFNQIFNGFLLGLVLGYIALKSGSVIPSIICHIFANANAMFAAYFFEYKMAAEKGFETAASCEMIYFAVCLVIGIVAGVIMLKKYGKLKNTDIIVPEYTFEVEPDEEKKLTWKLLLKSPTFWISAVYCIYSAVIMVTPV